MRLNPSVAQPVIERYEHKFNKAQVKWGKLIDECGGVLTNMADRESRAANDASELHEVKTRLQTVEGTLSEYHLLIAKMVLEVKSLKTVSIANTISQSASALVEASGGVDRQVDLLVASMQSMPSLPTLSQPQPMTIDSQPEPSSTLPLERGSSEQGLDEQPTPTSSLPSTVPAAMEIDAADINVTD